MLLCDWSLWVPVMSSQTTSRCPGLLWDETNPAREACCGVKKLLWGALAITGSTSPVALWSVCKVCMSSLPPMWCVVLQQKQLMLDCSLINIVISYHTFSLVVMSSYWLLKRMDAGVGGSGVRVEEMSGISWPEKVYSLFPSHDFICGYSQWY